jgi:hypothetical protein
MKNKENPDTTTLPSNLPEAGKPTSSWWVVQWLADPPIRDTQTDSRAGYNSLIEAGQAANS